MSLTKKVYLTISGYDIKLSDNLTFYQKDQLKLIFYINEYGIDYENNATARTLMPVNPLNAILFIENPDGVDSVSSARIEDNAVTFYLDSTHTQYVGVSRMQLRLFDQDGCAITLPHFTFEIRENIYGSGDVRFQNVVMVDQTGTVILTEDNDLLDVGDILTMGTEVAYPQVAKTIKELPVKNNLDGTEKLIVEDNEATKQAPLTTIVDEIKQNSQEKIREIESELNQTNAQLSQISNETSYLVKKVEDGSDCTNYLKSEFLKAKSRKNTTVLLESGTYHIKSLELLSNMTYTGIGEVVFKSHSSCSSDKWDNACISRGVKNIKINNIIFDGNKEQVPGNGWQGVASLRFEDSSNITVSDCEFRNNFYLNSVFKGCSFVKINNNKYYNSDVGVLFMTKPSNNVDVCYNYFDGGTSEAISIYDIDNTDENVYHHDFNIIGNVIKNKVDSQSIYIKRCYNINVSNNSIDNVGTGIGFVQQDGTDNVSKYANVSNNIINNARFNGIQISYCEESIFTGNTITNSLVYGIDSRNSKEIIVSNNVISETNIGNDNLDTSFMIQFRDAKNITIHSNYMKNSKKLRSCFFASNTNGLVLSNNISNYLDSKFLDLNSTNTTNIDVYNNVGHFPNSPVSIRSAFGNINPTNNTLPTVNVDLSWRTLSMPYYDDIFYLASNSESDIINEDFSTGRNARVGRIITIISKTDKIQIQNSVNISLKSSPYKTKIGDTLNFVFDGAKWVQI